MLGNQVAPAEVSTHHMNSANRLKLESLLLNHEAVRDCCVVGRSHRKAGEVPWAFVVLKEGRKPSKELERSLLDFVKERKIRYKHLAGLDFVKAIHKSGSGKILRSIINFFCKTALTLVGIYREELKKRDREAKL